MRPGKLVNQVRREIAYADVAEPDAFLLASELSTPRC